MNQAAPNPGQNVDEWMTERIRHGLHVLVNLEHLPSHFLVHPGCAPEDCELRHLTPAPGQFGIYVPEVTETGLMVDPRRTAQATPVSPVGVR